MSSKIESVASSIRDAAHGYSVPLNVSAAMTMDMKYSSPEIFRDEFSEIVGVEIVDGNIVFKLSAKRIEADLFELYNIVLEAVAEAGYRPITKTSLDIDAAADLTVIVKKGDNDVGKIRVMRANTPVIGADTDTYDNYGSRGTNFEKERGVMLEFDEYHQVDATEIVRAYDEKARKFLVNAAARKAGSQK